MNKLYCLIIMFFTCRVCEAQNLVPNPSFEIFDTCPNTIGQIARATGWLSFTDSPDYFNGCANPSSLGVPFTGHGYQPASEGSAFAGALMYSHYALNVREYFGIELQQQLLIGVKYFVSFKVALADYPGTNCAVNKIGAKFTTYSFNAPELTTDLIDNNAKVYSDSIIADSINWTFIHGSFISDSAYQYIVIGNFFVDSLTDTLHCVGHGYYYTDEVCVSTDSLTCNPPVGINEIKGESEISLFPNPFSDKINITTKRNELVEINFYDVTARKIFNQSFKNSTSINAEQLAKGIYLYEVRNKNGVIKKGKIVKD